MAVAGVAYAVGALLLVGLLLSEHWRWRAFTERRRIRLKEKARRGFITTTEYKTPQWAAAHWQQSAGRREASQRASVPPNQVTERRAPTSTASKSRTYPEARPATQLTDGPTAYLGAPRIVTPGSCTSVTALGRGDHTTDAD